MKKKWIEAYLGLGSNLGDRKKNILFAEELVIKHPEIKIQRKSSLYRTSPVGPRQNSFFNGVLKVKTSLSPGRLLSALKSIEKEMQRKKTFHWGPRTIDLDLLLYGNLKVRSRKLIVPHPEFSKRKFVLKPLSEIAPSLRPAGFKKNVSQLCSELTDSTQKVRLIRAK